MYFDLNSGKEIFTINIPNKTAYPNRWIATKEEINKFGFLSRFRTSYGNEYITKGTLQKVSDNINQNLIKKEDVNLSSTLYFDKSCTFPRYKLEGTNFKRCIKIDKADYIIIPKNFKYWNFNTSNYKYKIEEEKRIYLFGQDAYDLIPDKSEFNIELFEQTDYVYADTRDIGYLVHNILNVYNKPFILEEDLDRLISETHLEKLDADTINSIYEMMSSKDADSVELGCKLLSSFNVFDKSLTTSLLLFLTQDNWFCNKGSKSVAFKSMLQSLHYADHGYRFIELVFQSHQISNAEDRELSKLLIEPWLRKEMIRVIGTSLDSCPYKINFNITVE